MIATYRLADDTVAVFDDTPRSDVEPEVDVQAVVIRHPHLVRHYGGGELVGDFTPEYWHTPEYEGPVDPDELTYVVDRFYDGYPSWEADALIERWGRAFLGKSVTVHQEHGYVQGSEFLVVTVMEPGDDDLSTARNVALWHRGDAVAASIRRRIPACEHGHPEAWYTIGVTPAILTDDTDPETLFDLFGDYIEEIIEDSA